MEEVAVRDMDTVMAMKVMIMDMTIKMINMITDTDMTIKMKNMITVTIMEKKTMSQKKQETLTWMLLFSMPSETCS